jgi:hypothetical protein
MTEALLTEKELRRAAKAAKIVADQTGSIDCACVIHGDGYDWIYVDRLYNMLTRHFTKGIRLHVYTEHSRSVPDHMIKHVLDEWPGLSGRRRSWWYKMQLFNPDHYAGQLLYLDLDTVIVNDLDWILNLDTRYFWSIRDFQFLWKPHFQGINSSLMYWNTVSFAKIWEDFSIQDINQIRKKYNGDQDYLSDVLPATKRKFIDNIRALSWRWQALDGGMNFQTRTHKIPNKGTEFGSKTSLLIFHGNPKPDQVQDPVVQSHWR